MLYSEAIAKSLRLRLFSEHLGEDFENTENFDNFDTGFNMFRNVSTLVSKINF